MRSIRESQQVVCVSMQEDVDDLPTEEGDWIDAGGPTPADDEVRVSRNMARSRDSSRVRVPGHGMHMKMVLMILTCYQELDENGIPVVKLARASSSCILDGPGDVKVC